MMQRWTTWSTDASNLVAIWASELGCSILSLRQVSARQLSWIMLDILRSKGLATKNSTADLCNRVFWPGTALPSTDR